MIGVVGIDYCYYDVCGALCDVLCCGCVDVVWYQCWCGQVVLCGEQWIVWNGVGLQDVIRYDIGYVGVLCDFVDGGLDVGGIGQVGVYELCIGVQCVFDLQCVVCCLCY